ncbi:Subtilase family protein [Prunus dulcis]|uniref:Subtilase family protein n=1 Tax=Prunus dulcis TaxID=3755 RepID=A0A4Y1RSN1_PRUDU|nr:Subtilase family protein [Prunus dulcis]
MAPGSLVLAAWIPNDTVGQIGQNVFLSNEYHMVVSGTSMATPHVSGVVALLKSKSASADPGVERSWY